LEYIKEDETALTAIKRGFNTNVHQGRWQHLPDYEQVVNPFPTSRIIDNKAKKIR
jgi:hypothetical protein